MEIIIYIDCSPKEGIPVLDRQVEKMQCFPDFNCIFNMFRMYKFKFMSGLNEAFNKNPLWNKNFN